MRDSLLFLRQWAAAPLQIAAIAPSGARLAALMTAGVGPSTGPVLELGPGTGVFTQAMLRRGLPVDQLQLVELKPALAGHLRATFPGVAVHCMSAADIGNRRFFAQKVDLIISGLGLLAMPAAAVEAIVDGACQQLRPGGTFVQFTYGPRCPVPDALVRKHRLAVTRVGHTLRNMPPATVYRLQKPMMAGDAAAGPCPM